MQRVFAECYLFAGSEWAICLVIDSLHLLLIYGLDITAVFRPKSHEALHSIVRIQGVFDLSTRTMNYRLCEDGIYFDAVDIKGSPGTNYPDSKCFTDYDVGGRDSCDDFGVLPPLFALFRICPCLYESDH